MTMKTLEHYAIKSLVTSFLAISFIILGLIWLTQSMKILDLIVNKGVGFWDFIQVSILILPSLLFFLLPITYLLAVTYCIYKIQQDRELVILKSIGISNKSIIAPALKVGIVIMIFSLINGSYLMPLSQSKFKSMNEYFQNEYATLLLEEKTFDTQGKLTVYIHKKDESGLLSGVFINDAREHGKHRVISAARGSVKQTSSGPIFELIDGTQQETDSNGKISILSFEKYNFNISKISSGRQGRYKSAVELTTLEIIKEIRDSAHTMRNYYSAINQRLIWPTFVVSLSYLTGVLLLGARYQRRYNIKQYIKCLIMSSAILVLAIVLINSLNYSLLWMPLLYLTTTAPFVSAVWLLNKME